jgi:hypothetical protein
MKLWPFEIPLEKLEESALEDVRIVVAEVLPSLNAARPEATEIRDEAQVRSLCEALAERDAGGKLGAMFGGMAALTEPQKAAASAEEGWILGI